MRPSPRSEPPDEPPPGSTATTRGGLEVAEVRRWTALLLPLTAIMVTLTAVLALPGLLPVPRSAAVVTGVNVLALGLALGLARRGRFAAAGVWTILSFVVLTAGSVAAFGGLRGTLSAGFLVVVLVAGALRGWRAAVWATLASAVAATGVLLLESRGTAPLAMDHLLLPGAWATLLACLAMALVLMRAFASTEEAARRRAALSERRLSELIRESPDGIVGLDDAGCVLECNDAAHRLCAVQSDQALGRPVAEVLRPSGDDDAARLEAALADARDGSPSLVQLRLGGAADGAAPVAVEAHVRRVVDRDGSWALQLVLRDITERVAAEQARRAIEQRAQEAQRLESLGLLAGGVAHDFRNLLTVILGNTALLRDEAGLPPGARALLAQIEQAGDHAASLTGQLLNVARREIVRPSVFPIGDSLRELEPMLRRLVPEDVDLLVSPGPATARVCIDRGQLEQIVVNLVTNACDAMPSGGRLTLEATTREVDEETAAAHPEMQVGPYVLLAVSDTGVGMPAAIRDRVFDPFFTTKPPGEGSGLGLASAHGIARQADGLVTVYSEPGMGTTFKVYLPAMVGDDAGDGGADAEAEAPTRTSAPPTEEAARLEPRPAAADDGPTVLVVDDDPGVRKMVVRTLRRGGYDVLEARDGDHAVAVAAAHEGPLRLMISDVVMPGRPGPAVAAALREARPGLRVLYLSGYTENAIVHRGQLDPDVAFLAKPFMPRELLDAVAAELARGGA